MLTGGPGSGKTTLVEALKARGYATTDEAGRGVIREQMQSGGDGVALDRPRAFRRTDVRMGAAILSRSPSGRVARSIFDRGLPDTIGYLRLEGLEVPAWMEEEAWRLRYNRRVFIAPPWKEIYGKDEERRQSWDVAVRTYEIMAEIYAELGYELVELPRASVAQRAEFVIAEMGLEVPNRT